MKRAINRTVRTFAQVVAAGGLTGLVAAIADGLTPYTAGILLAGSTVVATFLHNLLEDLGAVGTVLEDPRPAPGKGR